MITMRWSRAQLYRIFLKTLAEQYKMYRKGGLRGPKMKPAAAVFGSGGAYEPK